MRLLLIFVAVLAGCSTGPFLKPTSQVGHYAKLIPACGGPSEVVEFTPEKQPWVQLRVYATPPGWWEGSPSGSTGTELRIHAQLSYGKNLEPIGLFPSDEKRRRWEAAIEERSKKSYQLVASKSSVILRLPGATEREVVVPLFEKPLDIKTHQGGWWWARHRVQLSPDRLEEFEIILPEIRVNGETVVTAPIQFLIAEELDVFAAMVINC